MAICGYNEKIGNGLKMLVEGMIDALEKKVATSSTEAVLKRELVELDAIISVLKTAPGEVLPEMFIGLNLLAKSMFSEVQKELHSSGSKDLAAACRKVGNNFVDLLAQTELKNEDLRSHPAAGGSIATNAQNLAKWALEKSLLY